MCIYVYIKKCKLKYAILFGKLMRRPAEMNLNMQLMQSINHQCSSPCIPNQGNIQIKIGTGGSLLSSIIKKLL